MNTSVLGSFLPTEVKQRYPLFCRVLERYGRRRMEAFIRCLKITEGATILDLGSQPYYWQNFPNPVQVTCLNRYADSASPRAKKYEDLFTG